MAQPGPLVDAEARTTKMPPPMLDNNGLASQIRLGAPATQLSDRLPVDKGRQACLNLPVVDIETAIYNPPSASDLQVAQDVCPAQLASANAGAGVIGQSITSASPSWLGGLGALFLSVFGRKKSFIGRTRCGSHHPHTAASTNRPSDALKDTPLQPLPTHYHTTKLGHIPSYVLEYAPYVHLFSNEAFWPCDLETHLNHTTPFHDFTAIRNLPAPANLSTLHYLNYYMPTYLHSNDNPEDRPEWLLGKANMPVQDKDVRRRLDKLRTKTPHRHLLAYNTSLPLEDWADAGTNEGGESTEDWNFDGEYEDHIMSQLSSSELLAKLRATQGTSLASFDSNRHVHNLDTNGSQAGYSSAPATLIVVPKPNGIVDAFWFFFYSFNLGNSVFSIRFGNHVGDWEHTMIRFQHGQPKAVYYSEHAWGNALAWSAVEKIGKRPVTYSATGTHAMYPNPAIQPYILPWGILHDETDRGPLWDPLLNVHGFTFNYQTREVRTSDMTPSSPREWLWFAGRWGDKEYPLSDPRQYSFLGQHHYDSGPTGPRWKNLGRTNVCQGSGSCPIKTWMEEGDVPVEPVPVHVSDREEEGFML